MRETYYHAEGDDRISGQCWETTREMRRWLRAHGLRYGRWRYVGLKMLAICEVYAGGDLEPGAHALIWERRSGRVLGSVYRHGGRVVGPSREEMREMERWLAFMDGWVRGGGL